MNINPKYINAKSPTKKVASSLLRAISSVLATFTNLLVKANRSSKFIRLRYLDFVPRPDDVFIVTYPRSGSTWLQMILYQLTTDGNMDFTHISERCPGFEGSPLLEDDGDFEIDLEALPSPRIFKSHLSYRWIPKGPCKYIYVARNNRDVAVSFFHFYTTHLGFKGTFSEFLDFFMRGEVLYGSWFKHVDEWSSHRKDSNVLFLKYEDLTHDLPSCIRKIIAFCGFEVESEKFTEILERCSFTFMKKHESKFDRLTEKLWKSGFKQSSFIRKGQVGGWTEYLSSQQEMFFEQEFDKHLGKFGIDWEHPTFAKTLDSRRCSTFVNRASN